mmetsp:Transcript_17297/g.39159  ORF Transcript_17297/g.39159 Transcript_17297/m.39159 type:complete len:174 (-) Transcript_17297:56-577(-)
MPHPPGKAWAAPAYGEPELDSSAGDSGDEDEKKQQQQEPGTTQHLLACCRDQGLMCRGEQGDEGAVGTDICFWPWKQRRRQRRPLRDQHQLLFDAGPEGASQGFSEWDYKRYAPSAKVLSREGTLASHPPLRWVRHELTPISERSEPPPTERPPVLVSPQSGGVAHLSERGRG